MANLDTPCINWVGTINADGYGRMMRKKRVYLAHRAAYERQVGPIPEKMVIDHLCRNRRCINVQHMEVVTIRENTLRGMNKAAQNARKTHCKRGHLLDGKNLYRAPNGSRACKTCMRTRDREVRRVAPPACIEVRA